MIIMNVKMKITVTVLVVFLLGYFILFVYSPVPKTSSFELDFKKLRTLSSLVPGEKPKALNVLKIAKAVFPKTAVLAGSSFADHGMVMTSYQLKYPDDSYLLIDTVHDKAHHKNAFQSDDYNEANYEIMQKAIIGAKQILFTHEHEDHTRGLAQAPSVSDITDKILLTHEQITSPELLASQFKDTDLAQIKPLKYDQYHPLAPGIVLLKAAGHTLGSQIIYINLSNGNEYLLVGDVVWSQENIDTLNGRPALISWLIISENRTQTGNQIRALHELKNREPEINILVSHDIAQHQKYINSGKLGDGFEL